MGKEDRPILTKASSELYGLIPLGDSDAEKTWRFYAIFITWKVWSRTIVSQQLHLMQKTLCLLLLLLLLLLYDYIYNHIYDYIYMYEGAKVQEISYTKSPSEADSINISWPVNT